RVEIKASDGGRLSLDSLNVFPDSASRSFLPVTAGAEPFADGRVDARPHATEGRTPARSPRKAGTRHALHPSETQAQINSPSPDSLSRRRVAARSGGCTGRWHGCDFDSDRFGFGRLREGFQRPAAFRQPDQGGRSE